MGSGYIRQSSAQIVDGNTIFASNHNAEYNALQSAFDGVSGHAHDGTTGNGPKISLTNSISGVLPIINGGTGGIHKLNATTAPAAGDDSGDGYAVGSIWVDTTNDHVYICTNNSLGAANWIRIQVRDAALDSIAGLTTSANQMVYTTGSDTYATTSLTSFARTLIDDADASTALSTLGFSTYGKTLIDDADASMARGTLGLGTIATQSASSVNISGGTISGVTITGSSISSMTDIAVADGGTGASTVEAARTNLELDKKAIYATKTGNYTAVDTDNNAVHRFTSSATLSLTAAATLGANWHYTIITAAATVTIDPNGSETVDGATLLIIPPYSSAKIYCTGTEFFTEIRLQSWEKIADRTITAQASEPFIDLSAYRKLRLSGYLSVSTSTGIYIQTSTDNGSSYADGGSDYFYIASVIQGGTLDSAYTSGGGAPIILNLDSGSTFGTTFVVDIENFNKALPARFLSTSSGFYLTDMTDVRINTYQSSTTARNALRVFTTSGTETGTLTLEGIRG